MNTNKLSYNKYVTEIIGTLLLVLIVALSGQLVFVFAGVTLAIIVYIFGGISGAHVNPAFTISAWTLKKIGWKDAVLYLCSQLIGAGIALIVLKNMGINLIDIGAMASFSVTKSFWAELIGTLVFSMTFAAALNGKTNSGNVGFVVGGGLFLGILFATVMGGLGVLNPAVAIGSGALHWTTIVGPILGALIGTWLYKYLVMDSKGKVCTCDGECVCGK